MKNIYHTSSIKEQRRIFFSGTSGSGSGGSSGGSASSGGVETREKQLTPEQERQCTQMGQWAVESGLVEGANIAIKFKEGKIEQKAFEEAYEILKNPEKNRKDPYRNFIKALGKGVFSENAKRAHELLSALESEGPAKNYVAEEIRKLSEENSTISKDKENRIITEMRRIMTGEPAGTAEEISSDDRVKQAAEIASKAEKINWPPDLPSKEIVEKLNRLERKEKELFQKMLEAEKKLDKAIGTEARDSETLKKAEAEYNRLNKEFEKLQKELEGPRLERQKYMERVEAQYDALESFFKYSGIDLREASRLKMWLLKSAEGKIKGGEPLKLKGVVTDSEGRAGREVETFTIESVHFERESGAATETPGTLIITYKNSAGTTSKAPYSEFLKMINAMDGHEEIESSEKMNERISGETFNKKVEVGQEYNAKVTVGMDENGKILEEEVAFKVENIDEEKKIITLNHEIKAVPKEWVSHFTPELRFDRIKKDFSYGEFVKLLKQHNYKRKVSMEEVGPIGENGILTEEVIFIDENGCQRWGKIQENKEAGTYSVIPLEVKFEQDEEKYLAAALDAGIPREIATKTFATLPLSQRERQKLSKMSPTDLMDMIQKGQIAKTPPQDKMKRTSAEDTRNPLPGTPPSTGDSSAEAPTGTSSSGAKKDGDNKEDDEKVPEGLHPEGLPYEKIKPSGETISGKKRGFLRELWDSTHFMSASDLWVLGKSIWEYHVRQHERKQKRRIGEVGEGIHWFDKEASRVKQQAETENVNQFKEAFMEMPSSDVQKRLRISDSQDEMKAAFIVLTDKGQMRWDDVEMWKNLNTMPDIKQHIFTPSNGDPACKDRHGNTGEDYLEGAIDSIWGEGTFNEWKNKNNNAFKSKMKENFDEGERLLGVDGGHERRMADLLKRHKQGEYIDPHAYAGVLMHAVEIGKMGADDKLYYLLEGVAAENQNGHTILPSDFFGTTNATKTNNYPIMEFLTGKGKRQRRNPETGEMENVQFGMEDYRNWVRYFDEGSPQDPEKCKPGKMVSNFLFQYVFTQKDTLERIDKAITKVQDMDHEDIPFFLPYATSDSIKNVCMRRSGGDVLTIKGYTNAFTGYNQAIRSLAVKGDKDILSRMIKAYVQYEGILCNRYEKSKDYKRLTEGLNEPTIISGRKIPPRQSIGELNTEIEKIVSAYEVDNPELRRIYELMKKETPNYRTNQAEKREQEEIDQAFDRFNEEFDKAVNSDDGARMLNAIDPSKLSGMGG